MIQDHSFPVNAQFVDTYFPTIDGVVRTVHNYANIMNEGSYSCVIAPKTGHAWTDRFSYDVMRTASVQLPLREYCLGVPALTVGLGDFLESRHFEVFHAHSPFVMGRYALSQARRLGIPIVATFHSKYYDDILRLSHSEMIARQITRSIVEFYESVDSVWAVSEGTAETLRSYGYTGDISVVDNGTDYDYPDDPCWLSRKASERFQIAQDRPVLLFVGHQIWQKNLKLVLDTAAVLKQRGFDFQCMIVGGGYAEKAIRDYAVGLGLDDRFVHFTGQISDIELMKGLYLSCGLFFFPSMYDNAPLVLREASAMGLPSLLLRGSNSAENIQNGVNGYLTGNSPQEAADIIQAAFSNPIQMTQVGQAARKSICHPWSEVMELVGDRYRELAGERICVR